MLCPCLPIVPLHCHTNFQCTLQVAFLIHFMVHCYLHQKVCPEECYADFTGVNVDRKKLKRGCRKSAVLKYNKQWKHGEKPFVYSMDQIILSVDSMVIFFICLEFIFRRHQGALFFFFYVVLQVFFFVYNHFNGAALYTAAQSCGSREGPSPNCYTKLEIIKCLYCSIIRTLQDKYKNANNELKC